MSREISTIVTAKTIKGTSFVGLRNYTNSKGEVSNQTILAGIDYGNAKAADLKQMEEFDINSFESQFSESVRLTAKAAIIKSLSNPEKAQSDAQKDAYTHIAPGVKVHNESNHVYLFGFSIAKTVITPGVYPHVNSRETTLAKKEMIKAADLKTSKYRSFSIGSAEELKLEGTTI